MRLPIEGTSDTKWVLVCNLNPGGPFGGSATQYFVGSFDGHQFTCESSPATTKWADYGKDHYAAVTFSNATDDRHIMMDWMSNWQYGGVVPTKQYRSSNSIPRDLSLYEQDKETYLRVVPSPEMLALRSNTLLRAHDITVSRKGVTKEIGASQAGVYEILVDFVPSASGNLQFTLSNKKGEKVTMTYDIAASRFVMDRTHSGDTSFSSDFSATTAAPVIIKSKMQLRIFVDKSSIEAFDGNGRFAMTNLVFPSEPYNQISCSGIGKSKIKSLVVYNLK
jgi:sucrose-6-phosphate hydrolase SacC (GH32 family)